MSLGMASGDFASSPSGYFISVCVVLIMGMVAYFIRRNDKQTENIVKEVGKISGDHQALALTVAVLSKTVDMLKQTVDKLPDIKR